MITLLLAEDELYTRKGLMKHINFTSIGIDYILEAENGQVGLLLAHNNKIDILLTDVRMPHMNGIELAKSIRALYPDCIILFLSGYSDREYLRGALSLRTFRYIDKPVDMIELANTLSDAVCLYKRFTNSTDKNLNEVRKKFARDLVSTSINITKHPETMRLLGISPSAFFDCRTLIIQLLNNDTIQTSTDFSPSLFHAQEKCEHFFKEYNHPALISEFKEQYILIHMLSSDKLLSTYSTEYFERLFQALSLQLNEYPHFISVGNIVHSMHAIESSYNNAVINLQCNYYLGLNSISLDEKKNPQSYEMSLEIYQLIQESVINHDEAKCISLVNQLYQQYHNHPCSLVSNTKASYHQLLFWLFQYKSRKQSNGLFQNKSYLLERITNSCTLDDLHTFALNYFKSYFKEIPESTESYITNQIIDLINHEYSNSSLGIQYICDRIKLSPSHASYVFKQSSGETINQYIQNVRIQKAEYLLCNTQMKIAEIALTCGFPDSNYFTKLFRKKIGLLPSKYREVHSV